MERWKDGNIAKVIIVGEASPLCPRMYRALAVPLWASIHKLISLADIWYGEGAVPPIVTSSVLDGCSGDAAPTKTSVSSVRYLPLVSGAATLAKLDELH